VVHADGAPDDVELVRFVLAAAARSLPVAVTELAVGPRLHAWERDAAALVAETARGAELLRAKWADRRVELIPPGCPPCAPARKRRRRAGQAPVVATFAEQPSCLWAALEAATALDGRLLVLGAAGGSLPRDFKAAAAAVDLQTAPPEPGASAAARLADKADVVVLWHEDASDARASRAARMALASGVPLVAARTTWVDGLEGCVHQPDDAAAGARRVLEDAVLRRSLADAAREHCEDNSWPRIAERHKALWCELEGR
jgi:glycosyltransferase involved in cell wall biosynthesis